MNFGAQTVFDYVRKMITDPDSDDEYHILYDTVRSDCLRLLRSSNLSQEDKDDIIQNVQVSLFAGLVRYVERYSDASEPQRNAFLRTILFRRRDDLLAHSYKHSHTVSYDADGFPLELCGSQDDLFATLSTRDELLRALNRICAADFPAEKIIAFLFAICTALSGKNSKPAIVSRSLFGLPLNEAAFSAIGQIQAECPFPIDPKVYAPLFDKLEQPMQHGTKGDCRFSLTPRAISDASSQLADYLRKRRDHFNGGNTL